MAKPSRPTRGRPSLTGRPGKGAVIGIVMRPETIKAVRRLARANDMTASAFCRFAIEESIVRHSSDPQVVAPDLPTVEGQ